MLSGSAAFGLQRPVERRPNVVLIITDDQGYGDLGFHGNSKIRTPHLDAFARQSVRFRSFYVLPVCAPTRASLMTGRYYYRTGVTDTYIGRAMMHGDEVTLAEMLVMAGYSTGIFGKWHLGDNFPMRPIDQGFQEALVHRGGGIGQPADPPGNDYFDPALQHNGKEVKTQGYCSDVFTDAAIHFIEENKNRPFFAYLAYNAPHTPLRVPERYRALYEHSTFSRSEFASVGHPLPSEPDAETTARVYGMATNIDDNVGRLLGRLKELGLFDDTVVLFLTDNGPQQVRYNAGMLERKGSVHEGGIRVPLFVRWPGKLKPGLEVPEFAAVIDIAPTILEICGAPRTAGVRFDGTSVLPLLQGRFDGWPDRTLFVQWHRGDIPELLRAFAVRSRQYKLVQSLGAGEQRPPDRAPLRLYDMIRDPLEQYDIASDHPETVRQMREAYEAWFRDVAGTRGFAPPRIQLGAPQENPAVLTRQDWRGPRAGFGENNLGYWDVHVTRPGRYDVTLRFAPAAPRAVARFSVQDAVGERQLAPKATDCTFRSVRLAKGDGRLEASIAHGDKTVGVHYVEVARR
ncbi:MAG: arylsulfatase [Gammaproteobacteria bacterium]